MTEEFGHVEVFTGQEQAPEGPRQMTAAPSTMATVEQARAIAETQSALVIARANPRDEYKAHLKIQKACKRQSLAEVAKYAYRRGGTLVQGESIKLLQVIAQCWGNMDYGFRELDREGDKSEVEAYAWDLEGNVRAKRAFQVRHYRDKKDGAVKVEGERNTYELIAGMAQRRVRSCIEAVIPSDIIKSASAQCDKTLAGGDGKPLEDRVRDMLAAFDELGVSKDMIEARLQHKLTAIVPQELVQLTQIYRSIKDGVAPREDFFSLKVVPAGKTEDPEKPEHKPSIHKCVFPDCDFKTGSEKGLKRHTTQQHPDSPAEPKEPKPGDDDDTTLPLDSAAPTPPDPFVGLKNARESLGEDAYAVACESVFGEPERYPETPEEAKSVAVYMNQIAKSGAKEA
ncbi:hypothetical protein LCGC14_1017110 [marine sediment metagenome]|uniref:Uncharacterized protein n=1 Tax=marine sediment metagenome TaxID=412755 RepID=A0A0F9QGS7_9ZZZZ